MCCLNARVITVCACMSDVCVLHQMYVCWYRLVNSYLYICICLLSPVFCVLLLQKYAGDSDLIIDPFPRNLGIGNCNLSLDPQSFLLSDSDTKMCCP